MPENRRSERHRLAFKVVFDDGESYSVGEVEDISETGLYMHTSTSIPPDSIVRFEPTEDDEDALFEAAGRVVRCDDLAGRTEASHGLVGIAVEFVAMTAEEKAGVAQMIEALEHQHKSRTASGIRDPMLGMIVETGDVPGASAAAAAAGAAEQVADGPDETSEAAKAATAAAGASEEADEAESEGDDPSST